VTAKGGAWLAAEEATMERSLLDASAGAAAQLDPSVWRAPFRPDVVHGVVKWHLANRRQHGGAVKTVSEISGTGKKVYRQKGTGKVRRVWSLRPHFAGKHWLFQACALNVLPSPPNAPVN
jgi:hypothetical protein